MAIETAGLDDVGAMVELRPAQLALVFLDPHDRRRAHLMTLAARLGKRIDQALELGRLLGRQRLVPALQREQKLALVERSKGLVHLPLEVLEQLADPRQLLLDRGLGTAAQTQHLLLEGRDGLPVERPPVVWRRVGRGAEKIRQPGVGVEPVPQAADVFQHPGVEMMDRGLDHHAAAAAKLARICEIGPASAGTALGDDLLERLHADRRAVDPGKRQTRRGGGRGEMAGVAVAVERDRLEAPAIGLRLVTGETGPLDVVERQALHHFPHVVDVGKSQRRAVAIRLRRKVELRMVVAKRSKMTAAATLIRNPRDLGVQALVLDVAGKAGLFIVARNHPAEVVGAIDVVGGMGEGAQPRGELLVARRAPLVGDPARAGLVTDATVGTKDRVVGRQRALARPAGGAKEVAVENPAEDGQRRDPTRDEHWPARRRHRVLGGHRQPGAGEDALVLSFGQ